MDNYVMPAVDKQSFTCPYCKAYAQQMWKEHYTRELMGGYLDAGVKTSLCCACGKGAVWLGTRMLYPACSSAPLPIVDMPANVMDDFNEARNIVDLSPRGAAALLRLALQKLCVHLGEKGRDLNDDIGNLVRKGLDPRIQKALDFVRVVGNNAVHPGNIDLKDDTDAAQRLFGLVNLIVERMITQPKHIDALFEGLPVGAKDQIARRDSQS